MNKKLLVLSLAAILAAPAAFAVDPPPPSDTQTVTVTVPEVDLIDVAAGPIAISLDRPTQAGDGFVSKTATSTYAISANHAADGIAGKNKITVAVTTGVVPSDATLKVETTALGGGTVTAVDLTSATTSGTLMTTIGNVASTAGALTYTFGPTVANGMVGYVTGGEVILTYTVADV